MTRHAWFRFGLHALICALIVSVSADGVLNAWSNLGQDRGLGAALALAVWGAQPVRSALAAGVGVSLLAAAAAGCCAHRRMSRMHREVRRGRG